MTLSEMTNELIKQFLVDMGFDLYSSYPQWAYDLAENLVNAGWKKEQP